MPKRYVVTFAPGESQATSTASFRIVEDTPPNDNCPQHPRPESVPDARRKAFEKKAKDTGKKRWTCAELKAELGVTLTPQAHD
jgi:hypothetical protein